MKYEFHVRDYVETKTGTIGYVSEVPEKGLANWIPTKLSNKDIHEEVYIVGDSYCIPFPVFSVYNNFSRIGQYTFTKKDEGKIEKIDIKKTGCMFMGREVVIFDAISNKINELVEAVNRLEEKVNEMA